MWIGFNGVIEIYQENNGLNVMVQLLDR